MEWKIDAKYINIFKTDVIPCCVCSRLLSSRKYWTVISKTSAFSIFEYLEAYKKNAKTIVSKYSQSNSKGRLTFKNFTKISTLFADTYIFI